MKTILVVDDKSSVRNLVRDFLESEGFRVVVSSNGEEALYSARREKPNLILLDIMMPGMSGYEFLKTYRKERVTPVILLTAKMEETDKVLGLELGADDYITKPFGMKELVARINAVLRRSDGKVLSPNILAEDDLRLDVETRSVTLGGSPVNLTPSEFDILHLFMSSPGRVFSRSDILFQTQGSTYEGVERTVDVHIRNLRSKIEKEPSSPEYIETVFGVGYRFRERRGKKSSE